MRSFTDINKLIKFLKLDKKNQENLLLDPSFPLLLPYSLAVKIKKNDPIDPIFKQFVPIKDEIQKVKGYTKDPLLEKKFTNNNLIKKYKNRALLITTNTCQMHCRFCFRKNRSLKNKKDFSKETELIKKDVSIEEIILSGGDPLSLSNKALQDLLAQLNQIKHLKRIRFHTRYIIAAPKRINKNFLDILKKLKKQIIFVFHINHPNEIDMNVINAVKKLRQLNILLFNQTVLLKGINDNLKTLKNLYEKLTSIGIIPYYLHQLDKVQSTHHFEVPVKKGKDLIKQLQANLPGYMIVKYVKEIPDQKNKTLLT